MAVPVSYYNVKFSLYKSRILSQIEQNLLRYRIPDTPGYANKAFGDEGGGGGGGGKFPAYL